MSLKKSFIHFSFLFSALLIFQLAFQSQPAEAQRRTKRKPPIRLKYFQHIKNAPSFMNHFNELFTGTSLSKSYIVQFRRPLKNADRGHLKKMGVQIFSYVPDYSYVVWMEPEAFGKVKELSIVSEVLPVKPAFRLQGQVLRRLNRQKLSLSGRIYEYNIIPTSKVLKKTVAQKLRQIGAKAARVTRGSVYISARLNDHQLRQVIQWDEVQWVDLRTRPERDMDNANIQGGADAVRAKMGLSLRGRGIRGHVLEGIYPDHPDFKANQYRKAPIAIGASGADSHGQATYGQVFGSGEGNPKAKGLLPDAQGFFTNYNEVYKKPGSRYALTENLIKNHGVMFQTASWGYSRTTEYTSESAEMDNIIFNLDIPVTQSQSNSGTRMSRPQAWAKNIISVGGLRHGNNSDPKDDRWGGASIGPATDGRIKPDLSAYYDQITTTSARGYTDSFGGTSGATPIVAGYVGLTLELWTTGQLGNPLPRRRSPRNIFANRPHFTTVKALLINSARQYQFSGASHNRTRVHQGWGFPNIENLVQSAPKNLRVVNESHVLQTGQAKNYSFNVVAGVPRLKVTLVYADPEGNPMASKQLVNDLDLQVTSPSGVTYWGNYGLLENMYSVPGGAPNSLDTVENVFVERPQAGTWKIQVIGRQISTDGHRETSEVDADYALVVRAGN